jgi:hypothetical protein
VPLRNLFYTQPHPPDLDAALAATAIGVYHTMCGPDEVHFVGSLLTFHEEPDRYERIVDDFVRSI